MAFIYNFIENIKEHTTPIQPESEYQSLSPVDTIPKDSEYLKVMSWAFTTGRVKNLAITGPYGSGKSSVIESFLKNNPSINKRSLRISMATFDGEHYDKEGNPASGKVKYKQDDIEQGILKQIFYKIDQHKIPQSRYRKLRKINFFKVWLILMLLAVIAIALGYVFAPNVILSSYEKVIVAGESLNLSKKLSLLIFVFIVVTISIIITAVWRSIVSRYKINEIKLPKDISLQRKIENDESVFNKNMDEIVYFFESTKFRYVFFEDFDRLDDASIFINLRELNTILNSNELIKEPIVFVYAVKDDLFGDTDRTKFFDFIIPIVPVINSTNSGEILLQMLDHSKELNKKHDISTDFVLDISPYISDMRVLQNIYNEFVMYKSILTYEQELPLTDQMMLAIIVFKNLYPNDFADIQAEKGIIKQAFEDKAKYIQKKKSSIDIEIAEMEESLESIKNETLLRRKELKSVFLSEITGWLGTAYRFDPKSNSPVYAYRFMEDSFDVNSIEVNDRAYVAYCNWHNSNSSTHTDNLKEIYDNFLHRFTNVSYIENENTKDLYSKLNMAKKYAREMSAYSLSQLLQENPPKEVLSNAVIANKLLVFLLRRKYIDENYANYINYFKESTITKSDMQFILGIKNFEPHPFNYSLTKTEMIVRRLQLHEFEQIEILNFDLLEYLLSTHNYDEQLLNIISVLSNGSDNSWAFIDEFVDRTKYVERFIQLLAQNWKNLWNYISISSDLSYERKCKYLGVIINCLPSEVIKELNFTNDISNFFISNKDILAQLNNIAEENINNVILELNIKFRDIQTEEVSSVIMDFIIDNNCYEINHTMLQKIVEYKNPSLLSQLSSKNYTTIKKLNCANVLNYIQKNIDTYIDRIFLSENNRNEEVEAVADILGCILEDKVKCDKIIQHVDFIVADVKEFCETLIPCDEEYMVFIINSLIVSNKIHPTWINVRYCYRKISLNLDLLVYINKNVSKLLNSDFDFEKEDVFVKELIESEVSQEVFELLFEEYNLESILISYNKLSESKMAYLIRSKNIKFTIENYNMVEKHFTKYSDEFIICNQNEYIAIHQEIPMSSERLLVLVMNPVMNDQNCDVLFKEYGIKYMSDALAMKLTTTDRKIVIDVFDAAWKQLDLEKKEALMMNHLGILSADKFNTCFKELGGKYSQFVDRCGRHDVNIENSKNNLNLANRLIKVGYITSYTTRRNVILNTGESSESLVLRIKAVKQ